MLAPVAGRPPGHQAPSRIRPNCLGPSTSVKLADEILDNRYTFAPHPTVTLPSNLSWAEDLLQDLNWQSQLHMLRYVKSLTRAWDMTGNQRYLDRAKFLLSDWHQKNPRTAPPSPYSWGGDTAGWRAEVFVCAAEILPKESWLNEALVLHGETLADPRYYGHGVGNHALYMNIGLLEVGCNLGRADWMALATTRANALIEQSIDAQGATNEQAIYYQYHNYQGYQYIKQRMAECGQTAGRLFARLDKMPLFLAHATLPDTRYAMLGDTAWGRAGVITGTSAEFAATQGKSGPKPPSTMAVYNAGFAFARTGWGETRPFADETMLTVRFGKARQIHGHHDGSSITLYAYGQSLLLDSGKYSYNRDAYRDYFLSRSAHNLVTVDNAQFDPTADTPLRWRRTSTTMFELATSGRPYMGVTAKRRTTLSRKLGYVVVDDRLSGSISRNYRQLWHLKENSKPVVRGSRVWTRQARGNVLIVQLIAPAATRVITGATSPIQGWVSYTYNQKIAAPVVEARRAGRSVQFLTLLVPYATTQPVVSVTDLHVTDAGYTMTVTIDGRSERLAMGSADSSITPLN